MSDAVPGMLELETLEREIAEGAIDTVITALPDLYGRLVGKRIHGSFFLDEIVSELGKGNRLEFRDFGVFEIRERAARVAQNPKTLARVHVPSKRTVKFKVGRLMEERLQSNHEPAAGARRSTAAPVPGGSDAG